MANEMRDRIINSIETARADWWEKAGHKQTSKASADYIADCLLDDGWIRPPCKVGETVYSLMECTCEDIDGVYTPCEYYTKIAEKMCSHPKGDCPYEYRIAECIVTDMNLLRFTKKWGKTVFLTKSEAEQKLKEMRGCYVEKEKT